jgi:hypothetical protein
VTKHRKSWDRCTIEDCHGRVEYTCDGIGCDSGLCRKHAKLLKHGTHLCPECMDGVDEILERISARAPSWVTGPK